MWDYMELPLNSGDLGLGEFFVEQCTSKKMQEYSGTIFLCCSPRDKERIDTFKRAALSAERLVKDDRACCAETEPCVLAKAPEKEAVFVFPTMQEYLDEYLTACPSSVRHLLIYSRRLGNGPSPRMSGFMDFWLERDTVDIIDLRYVDEAIKAKTLHQ